MADAITPEPTAPPRAWLLAPGLALAVAVALVALALGHRAPLIGAPVTGIVLGLALRNLVALPARCAPGIAFAGKQVLQWSIIALGFGLGLDEVVRTGAESLAVTVVTVSVAFLAAWLLGRWLRLPGNLTVLIGVGTAICGGSAIAATTPILRADEHDTAFAISTIFLFNVIGVLVFPPLGHLLAMSDAGFGLWAGTAINDTSSVVAAGYTYSAAAGDYATIVKLTRATLIIPVCLLLAFIVAARSRRAARAEGAEAVSLRRIFPWFILWFVVAAGVRTVGLVPASIQPALHGIAEFLIVVALTAIGLSADVRSMIASGVRPIVLGFGTWAAVALSSLAVQWIGHQL